MQSDITTHVRPTKADDYKAPIRKRFIRPATREFLTLNPQPNALLERVALDRRRQPFPLTVPMQRSGRPAVIDGIAAVPAPHLRVTFLLLEMANSVVSGAGVSDAWAFWEGQNASADTQLNGPYNLPAPGPGEVWPIDHANAIYQALTLDACGLSVSFPMDLESWVVQGEDNGFGGTSPTGAELGRVSLSDNDTLDRAGLYDFGYMVRASSQAGISDFRFAGIVSVFCTTDGDLD